MDPTSRWPREEHSICLPSSDEPRTEPQDEDALLVDLTVDSDEDCASNSAAVMQQNQPQSSRQPRRAQPSKLKEPAADSEDEDEEDEDDDDDDDDDESDEEASSSSRRRAVETGANSRGKKSNVYSLERITFNQLKEKDKEGAQRVLDHYKDDRRQGCVNLVTS